MGSKRRPPEDPAGPVLNPDIDLDDSAPKWAHDFERKRYEKAKSEGHPLVDKGWESDEGEEVGTHNVRKDRARPLSRSNEELQQDQVKMDNRK